MEQYFCKTRILSGAGSISALKTFQPKRLLLVTDPYFYENGTAAQVAAASGARDVAFFSEVTPDPSVELAAKGTALMQQFQPDLLAALGGGSTMDCAKAMAYFSGSVATFVAIPTTSGSGSEVTDFSILTHDGIKHPLVDPKLQPDAAILDSDLLAALPTSLIADGGFDVLTHALEAFTATGAGQITDALALEAFRTVYRLLPASFAGQRAVRMDIHTAATMAGMAFNGAGLGLCHAMAHSLGGAYHLSHGRLNAILLPAIIGCNAHYAADKYAALAAATGIGNGCKAMAARELKSALIQLRRQLHMPGSLPQAGIDPADVRGRAEELIASILADPCCQSNPAPVDGVMIRTVLEEVTRGG